MAGTVDQACGKIVILVSRAQCFTQSSSAVPQKVTRGELHIPGRKLSPPPPPGAAWAALFFPGSVHTWAQGFSSLCSGCAFLGPSQGSQAPFFQTSQHSGLSWPHRVHSTRAARSTLHTPFTHFIASMALSTSQHSAFICVSAYGPSPSD